MDITQIAALLGSVTGLISLILYSRFKMDGMRISNESKNIKNLQNVIAEIGKERKKLMDENEQLSGKVNRLELDVGMLKRASLRDGMVIDIYETSLRCRSLCVKKGDCPILVKVEELKKEDKEIKK